MTSDQIVLLDVDIASIARITYYVGGINVADAVPTDDLTVTGLTRVDGEFGGSVMIGSMQNNSSTTVDNPSVTVFGLNSAGRPLFATDDIELTSIAAGSSWSFTTSPSFDEAYATTVAFPEASDF
jgi:hypothetical protein